MSEEFLVPASPEELLDEDVGGGLKVVKGVRLAGLDPEDVADLADSVVHTLCEVDALDIVEQRMFDQVYALIRGFRDLPPVPRKRLLDALTSNLSVLNASIAALLAGGGDADAATTQAHRSALKAYVFFLHWAAQQCEAEAREAPPTAAAAGGRGDGQKRANTSPSSWDWEAQRPRVARALCGVSEVDLVPLFAPSPVEEPFLQLCMRFAQQLLDQPDAAALRDKVLVEAVCRTLAAAALRYGQLEPVAHTLFDVLNMSKHEHIPAVIADIVEFASRRNHDNRLAVELLRQVAAVDPADYERQMTATAASVRAVGSFIAELADRLPRTVGAHVSLLVPHLGCKAYPIRSGIVNAIGHMIARGFEAPEEDTNAPANAARLRTKQGLLDVLVERARDQTSWTRAAVCRSWAALALEGRIPMGLWLIVTELAIGRLEDKSANVRKAALQLLATLLLNNPFGPQLPADKFTVTLEEHRQRLKELAPDEEEGEDGSDADEPAAEPAERQAAVEAEPGDEAATGTAGDTQDTAADMEMSEGAAAAAAAGIGSEGELPGDAEGEVAPRDKPDCPARARPGNAGAIEHLRGLVASLESAVGFTKAVAGVMPMLTQLLASSSVADVQEAIGLLVTCHKFEIDGATATIRKMLPLIFSREQAVKDAVVDAIDELYLGNCNAEQAAHNLVDLAQGSNLGELGSLEDVMKALMHKGLLSDRTLKALWSIAAGRAQDGESEDAHLGRTRAALALIGMVAAQRPDTLQHNIDTLLQIGFEASSADAMMTRYACEALRRLADLPGRRDAAQVDRITRCLVGVLVAPRLQPAAWYSAAEAAVAAIYALHPAPGVLCAAVVHRLAGPAVGGGAAAESGASPPRRPSDLVSAVHLSRLFFMVGQTALQHLLLVERMAKAVRRGRADAEKDAAEAASERMAAGGKQGPEPSQEDINKELGVGTVSADLELDAMKDAADAEILGVHNGLGRYVPLIAAFCRSSALMGAHADLRASALLALTKLMAIEPGFCDMNLRLLFTLLQNRTVEPSVRSNLVIAIGDLAFRFPNLLEPWTANIYKPLSDPDDGVRKNALMVLTHLILNDMMKVKGHIARLATCLQDPQPRIASLAHLFFEELSHKVTKNVNPIYNLLPDILSSLGAEQDLTDVAFQAIMNTLLGYVKRDKYVDPLAEKLATRLGAVAEDPPAARNIAFCIAQLALSDKALRKLADMWKTYHVALSDEIVLGHFKAIVEKVAKRDKKADTKELVEDWEAKIAGKEAELQEEREAAAAKAAAAEIAAGGVKAEPEADGNAVPMSEAEAEGKEGGDGPEAVPESAAEVAAEAAASAATEQSRASGIGAGLARLQLSSADSGGAGASIATCGLAAVKSEPAEDISAAGPAPVQRQRQRASRASAQLSGAPQPPLVAVKPEPVEYEETGTAAAAQPRPRRASRHSTRMSAAGVATAQKAPVSVQRQRQQSALEDSDVEPPPAAAAPKSRRGGRLMKARDLAARADQSGDENDDRSQAAGAPGRKARAGRISQGGSRKHAAAAAPAAHTALRTSGLEDWSSDE